MRIASAGILALLIGAAAVVAMQSRAIAGHVPASLAPMLQALTGDAGYVDSYVEHFRASYGQKANWDGDYRDVGHWVAQFGMLAIQPLFGSRFR